MNETLSPPAAEVAGSRAARVAAVALAACAGVAFLLSALAIVPAVADLLVFVGLAAVFTAPGWPLGRWVAGDGADRTTRAILSLVLGYVLGATIDCGLRLAGVSSPGVVLGACAGAAVLLHWLARGRQAGVVALIRLGHADLAGLSVLWLVAAAIVGPVFARVGEATFRGLAYRAYFVADLWAHMSVVAELIKGATPPLNPYFPHESLPYYWGYFTLPALFSQFRPALLVDRGILLTDVGAAAAFVAVGYLVVRNLGASALATASAWTTVILASSFEGAWFLWQQWSRHASLLEFRTTNIDAVTRWFGDLPPVDGLHRAMWWTQQHETAISLGLLVLLVGARARRPDGWARAALEGLLLGAAVALSSFNGMLLVAAYALAEVALLAMDRGRGAGRWLIGRGMAAAIVLGFVGLTIALGMVQRTPGAFIFGWNRHFLRGPWRFILLSFGPALFLAPLGLARLRDASRRLVLPIAAVLLVSVAMFLFVDLRGHENTYVTFRTAQLTFLMLAILLAFAIDGWRRWPKPAAFVLWAALAVASLAALPTVAMDWYNSRDISNVEMNPGGFPWTNYLSREDQAAARWIQRAVPLTATVQTDAFVRARNTWAFVPVFARRRMGTGNGIFELNPLRFEPNMARIHEAYQSADADAAYDTCRRLGIDYLYVGDVEAGADAAGLRKFADHPDKFRSVYRSKSVEIFAVIK